MLSPKAVTFLTFEESGDGSDQHGSFSFSAFQLWSFGAPMKPQDSPTVIANDRTLRYVLLVSLTLSSLLLTLFIDSPNTATCTLQQTTFREVFAVAVSTF